MALGADVALGTRTDATRHARPHGKAARAHAWRRWRTGGADAWQGPRESTRTPRLRHVTRGHASEGPTG